MFTSSVVALSLVFVPAQQWRAPESPDGSPVTDTQDAAESPATDAQDAPEPPTTDTQEGAAESPATDVHDGAPESPAPGTDAEAPPLGPESDESVEPDSHGFDRCERPGLAKAGAGITITGMFGGLALMLPAIVQSSAQDTKKKLENEETSSTVDQAALNPTARTLLYAGIGTMAVGVAVGVPILLASGCKSPAAKSQPKAKKTSARRRVELRSIGVQPRRRGAGVGLSLRF